MTTDPRAQSRALVDGADRAAARAYFKAVGFTDADLAKPLVGVAHCWIEITPCNWNHRTLAEKVKQGIRAAGGTPIEFNSITVTDGIAMGTEGMKASLVSREVIADSVELVARGHLLDAFVGISGCDKTIPAMVMAMARLNLPSLMLYSGSIQYGEHRGRKITIQDVFEAIGAHNAGRIDASELREIENHACPGAGACGGQFTANTMATAFEMLGVSPMGFSDVPAVDGKKADTAFESGRLVMDLLNNDVRPRKIITRRSLHNAIAGVMATGGSTNAVLHLLAVAREAGVSLSIDEFDRIGRKTPLLADLKPWGTFTAPEMYDAGGMAVVAKRLLEAGLLNEKELTVTRRTIGEEARRAPETPGQKVIRPLASPLKGYGGIAILRGNLAPEGCVAKVSGQTKTSHRGPAIVFDRQIEPLRILGAATKHAALREKKRHAAQAEVPNHMIVARHTGAHGPILFLLYTNRSYGYNIFQ